MDFLLHIALTGETEEIEAAVEMMKQEMADFQNENWILQPVGVPRRFLRSTCNENVCSRSCGANTYNLCKVRATSWTHQAECIFGKHIVTMIAQNVLSALRHIEGKLRTSTPNVYLGEEGIEICEMEMKLGFNIYENDL